MSRLVDHPARYVLAAEVHARLPAELAAPCRASYIAVLVAADDRDNELSHIERLCERYGVSPPQPGATHFSASLDALRFKWERHGNFLGIRASFLACDHQPIASPQLVCFLTVG